MLDDISVSLTIVLSVYFGGKREREERYHSRRSKKKYRAQWIPTYENRRCLLNDMLAFESFKGVNCIFNLALTRGEEKRK